MHNDSIVTALVSIVGAIIGLAALAVLLSPNAHTAQVLKAAGAALATDIGAAVAPVSGGFGGLASMPGLGNGIG